MLADPEELAPHTLASLTAEAEAAAARQDDPGEAVAAVRAVRRRVLFRTSTADVLGLLDVDRVGGALADITEATLVAATQAAIRAVAARRGEDALPTRFAVIAMGRFGGRESGYGSDADVLFVHDPVEGADEEDAGRAAFAVANELRSLLMTPSTDPPLEVDADLRPEGRQGPLVRSLVSYQAYYDRYALVWEAQALLRARPVAGDAALGEDFLALVDPIRWPQAGLAEVDLREIRRIKSRVEAERLPRGADPTLHTKLGRGGLADVEWLVQTLQLQHAGAAPGLRTTRTLDAMAAAVSAGLLDEADAAVLAESWRLCSRVRNGLVLGRGKAGDMVPSDVRELRLLSHVLGYPPGQTGRFVDDYRRITRRARAVVERVFYG
jgi:glutamate-ammonia-ligase adenylyltransferase